MQAKKEGQGFKLSLSGIGSPAVKERVAVSHDGGVAHVELARADKLNAMDGEMFAAVGDTFRRIGHDPAVRAILLSGQGRHFTAGLDLEYASSQFPPATDAEVDAALTNICRCGIYPRLREALRTALQGRGGQVQATPPEAAPAPEPVPAPADAQPGDEIVTPTE